MSFARFLSAVVLVATLGTPLSAHALSAPLPVDEAFSLSAERASDGTARLRWRIADGYYLYRDRIAVKSATGEALEVDLPRGETKDDPTFGTTEIFHGEVDGRVASLPVADRTVEVSYQGCQDGGICYRPETRTVTLDGAAPASSAASALSAFATGSWKRTSDIPMPQRSEATNSPTRTAMPETVVDNLPAPTVPSTLNATGIRTDRDAGGMVASLLGDGGPLLVVATFFALGIGLAFTPCVFPMYPILAGQLTRSGERVSSGRGFTLSSAYVLAMAAAFGLLGVVAAWSGQNLQLVLQSDGAIVAVSVVFVVLALSMFGLFELRLPAAWTTALAGSRAGRRGSVASSAALGFTSALIVGPCVTAPLAGALIYIAQSGDVALGAAALFALGLGQGIPLVVFGTVGSRALPKAGHWMTVVTKAFGVAFLAMAIWMMSRILPSYAVLGLWSLLFVGMGLLLFQGGTRPNASGILSKVSIATGVAAVAAAGALGMGAAVEGNHDARPLRLLASGADAAVAQPLSFRTVVAPADLKQAMTDAQRPTLLYFTADWCTTCDVIEREVFADPTVRARLTGYRLLKADLTKDEAGGRALMKELDVVGPPTMVFVDHEAREVPGSRLVGDVSAQAFLDTLRGSRG